MAIKAEHFIWGAAAGGFLLLGGWLFYTEYEKQKHVNDYLDKVRRAEREYKNALDRKDYEEAQKILDFYQGLMEEEEKVIDHEGGMSLLIRRLKELGIIALPGIAGIMVINWLIKKYPPPSFKCSVCGATFSSQSALESHMQSAHSNINAAQVAVAQGAYSGLKNWIKKLLSVVSGVALADMARNWAELSRLQQLAIGYAAILILAFIVFDPFGWFAGLIAIAAMLF